MTKNRQGRINPLEHEHVAPEYLTNLKDYKYSGSDLSIIGNNIMQPYWNTVVKLVPLWVAPNVITMTGFIVSVSSTMLLLWYYFETATKLQNATLDWIPSNSSFGQTWNNALDMAKAESIPSWVWYYCGFALFAYQTLDAIDGKQARRTKSGSPMGELFDHGCDAFFTPLLQVNICIAIGMELFTRFHFFLLITSGLLLSIWEQFSTGTLDLGYINGPTDGILIVVGIFVSTGYYGPTLWTTNIGGYIPAGVLSAVLGETGGYAARLQALTAGEGLLAFVVITSIFTFIGNVLHVLVRRRVRGDALWVLIPNIAVFALYMCLFMVRPSLVEAYPFVVELAYGFLASYTATRLTVARLCNMPYRPVSIFFFVSFVVAGLAAGSTLLLAKLAQGEHLQLTPLKPLADLFASDVVCGRAMLVVVAVGVTQYLHLIVSVFRQLSHFLKIRVFSIKKNN